MCTEREENRKERSFLEWKGQIYIWKGGYDYNSFECTRQGAPYSMTFDFSRKSVRYIRLKTVIKIVIMGLLD